MIIKSFEAKEKILLDPFLKNIDWISVVELSGLIEDI